VSDTEIPCLGIYTVLCRSYCFYWYPKFIEIGLTNCGRVDLSQIEIGFFSSFPYLTSLDMSSTHISLVKGLELLYPFRYKNQFEMFKPFTKYRNRMQVYIKTSKLCQILKFLVWVYIRCCVGLDTKIWQKLTSAAWKLPDQTRYQYYMPLQLIQICERWVFQFVNTTLSKVYCGQFEMFKPFTKYRNRMQVYIKTSKLCQILKFLVWVYIRQVNLSHIETGFFSSFPYLTSLDMSGTQISLVKGLELLYPFRYKNMTKINFSRVYIKTSKLCQILKFLVWVYIRCCVVVIVHPFGVSTNIQNLYPFNILKNIDTIFWRNIYIVV
jgi:hypothetical protein